MGDRDEILVAELHRLGVRHLARLKAVEPLPVPMPPADLIAGPVASDDARLQAALILLFLRQPAYNQDLPEARAKLSSTAAAEVKLYYQAAVYLQKELEPSLRAYLADWQPLPDLFSSELGLPAPGAIDTVSALRALGERHRQLSDWIATGAAPIVKTSHVSSNTFNMTSDITLRFLIEVSLNG